MNIVSRKLIDTIKKEVGKDYSDELIIEFILYEGINEPDFWEQHSSIRELFDNFMAK